MKVQCPHCGGTVMGNGIGRKPLNIAVNKVHDALRRHRNVAAAANELGCSRGYIYKVLKTEGLTMQNVIKGKVAV